MVGKLLSFGEGVFSGAMLVLGSVAHLKCIGEFLKPNSDQKETSTQYIYKLYIYIFMCLYIYIIINIWGFANQRHLNQMQMICSHHIKVDVL